VKEVGGVFEEEDLVMVVSVGLEFLKQSQASLIA